MKKKANTIKDDLFKLSAELKSNFVMAEKALESPHDGQSFPRVSL
jgi:hypothetical protein